MQKNHQTLGKKAQTNRVNKQATQKSLQARERFEVSPGFAQISLVLLAVVLSGLLGYRLCELKWQTKREWNFLKCIEVSQFDNIEEILTNQIYVAPSFE